MIVTNDAALTSSQVAKRTPETWLDPIWAQTNSWQAIWVFTDSKLVQKQQRYSLLCVKAQSTQSYIDCHLISTFCCCPWSLRGHLRHFLILFGLKQPLAKPSGSLQIQNWSENDRDTAFFVSENSIDPKLHWLLPNDYLCPWSLVTQTTSKSFLNPIWAYETSCQAICAFKDENWAKNDKVTALCVWKVNWSKFTLLAN